MRLFAGRQRVTGLGFFQLGEGDGFTHRSGTALFGRLAEQFESACHAARFVVAGQESRAIAGLSGKHPHDRHFTAVDRVQRFEHIGDGVAALFHSKPLGGFGDAGRLVTQRLKKAQYAVGARGGTHQHRAYEPLAQFAGQIVEYFVARRLDVLEQLLHQLVVVVGESFQHRKSRRLFQIGSVAFEWYQLRGSVFFVNKSALQRQINKAGDDVARKSRDLPQYQFGAGRRLQQIEHIPHSGIGLIDLVDEQDTGDFRVFQFAQDQLQLWNLLLVHFADDDGGIDRRQYRPHVVNELHRAGTIQKRVIVAHEI